MEHVAIGTDNGDVLKLSLTQSQIVSEVHETENKPITLLCHLSSSSLCFDETGKNYEYDPSDFLLYSHGKDLTLFQWFSLQQSNPVTLDENHINYDKEMSFSTAENGVILDDYTSNLKKNITLSPPPLINKNENSGHVLYKVIFPTIVTSAVLRLESTFQLNGEDILEFVGYTTHEDGCIRIIRYPAAAADAAIHYKKKQRPLGDDKMEDDYWIEEVQEPIIHNTIVVQQQEPTMDNKLPSKPPSHDFSKLKHLYGNVFSVQNKKSILFIEIGVSVKLTKKQPIITASGSSSSSSSSYSQMVPDVNGKSNNTIDKDIWKISILNEINDATNAILDYSILFSDPNDLNKSEMRFKDEQKNSNFYNKKTIPSLQLCLLSKTDILYYKSDNDKLLMPYVGGNFKNGGNIVDCLKLEARFLGEKDYESHCTIKYCALSQDVWNPVLTRLTLSTDDGTTYDYKIIRLT